MSDMRKDFEAWATDFGYYVMRQDDGYLTETQYAYEGYRAGRAHGVDELIANIKARSNDGMTVALPYVEVAIRKHFGKEKDSRGSIWEYAGGAQKKTIFALPHQLCIDIYSYFFRKFTRAWAA